MLTSQTRELFITVSFQHFYGLIWSSPQLTDYKFSFENTLIIPQIYESVHYCFMVSKVLPTLQFFLTNSMQGSTNHSNMASMISTPSFCKIGGRACSQDFMSGLQPSVDGSRYTIPQRLTVAGWSRRLLDIINNLWMLHTSTFISFHSLFVWTSRKRLTYFSANLLHVATYIWDGQHGWNRPTT